MSLSFVCDKAAEVLSANESRDIMYAYLEIDYDSFLPCPINSWTNLYLVCWGVETLGQHLPRRTDAADIEPAVRRLSGRPPLGEIIKRQKCIESASGD